MLVYDDVILLGGLHRTLAREPEADPDRSFGGVCQSTAVLYRLGLHVRGHSASNMAMAQ